MKRNEHTFQFSGEQVAKAAAIERDYHLHRMEYWRDEQQKAISKAKASGVDVREYDVTGGKQIMSKPSPAPPVLGRCEMGSKLTPGKFDCYGNALPDEPMFILLGRDPHGPQMVRQWARQRHLDIGDGKRPASDYPMVDEALACADAMERWRKENDGKWRKTAS